MAKTPVSSQQIRICDEALSNQNLSSLLTFPWIWEPAMSILYRKHLVCSYIRRYSVPVLDFIQSMYSEHVLVISDIVLGGLICPLQNSFPNPGLQTSLHGHMITMKLFSVWGILRENVKLNIHIVTLKSKIMAKLCRWGYWNLQRRLCKF